MWHPGGAVRSAEQDNRAQFPNGTAAVCDEGPSFGENRLASLCTHNLYVQSSEAWDRLGGMSSRISTLNLVDVLFTALMNTSYQEYKTIMNQTNVPNRETKA